MQHIFAVILAEEVNYFRLLKPMIEGRAILRATTIVPTTITEVIIAAKVVGCTRVITTSPALLKLLLHTSKVPSVDAYAGSIIEFSGVEFLILWSPERLINTPYAKFLFTRWLDKFLAPQKFIQFPAFTWEVLEPKNIARITALARRSDIIAIDIETIVGDSERAIDCVGYCFVEFTNVSYVKMHCVVVPMDSEYNLAVVRTLNYTSAPKVFQNGKYDIAYFMRFNCVPVNYAFDTINLFHSWYSELPKNLGFITAFLLRKWAYWKDDGKSSDQSARYEYNAKDCYATAACLLTLLNDMPEWAINNFKKEFLVVFPCIQTEMTGLKRDKEFFDREYDRFQISLEKQLKSIRVMVDNNNFNPSSWQQTAKLFAILGSEDITKTDTPSRDRVKNRHPLNWRLVDGIAKYRSDRKIATSYLTTIDEEGNSVEWGGRFFYGLHPHATDTGRLASTESAYWCGIQIQNIPRDREDIHVKQGIVADPGFLFGECDRSQAEARDTAYLTGDIGLLRAVDDETKDFHGTNASSFFGIPYGDIVNSIKAVDENGFVYYNHKTLDKLIRDLAKRTNHGANYNMQAQMLLDTMGIKNVIRAKKLLGLPEYWSLVKVTSHLLECFDNTYPVVRGENFLWIIAQVAAHSKLVSPLGWTRWCFGKPELKGSGKPYMNALAAHRSQSLSAEELNIAYSRVFQEVALVNPRDFKLGPQIHDSIVFQYRIGRQDLAYQVQQCMDNPIQVTDISGTTRTLRIPTDLKIGGTTWANLKPAPRLLTSSG